MTTLKAPFDLSDICVYHPTPEPFDQDDETGLAAYLYYDADAPDPRSEWGAEDDSPDVDAWRQGEVYGIVVAPIGSLNPAIEQVYSCWGFYGFDHAKSECSTMLREAEEYRAI